MWKVTMYNNEPYTGVEEFVEYFDTEDEALDYMYDIEQCYDYVLVEEV